MLSLAGNVLRQADRNLKSLCALDFLEIGADETEAFFLLNGSVWSSCAKWLKAFRTLNSSATADGATKFFNGHWLAYAGEQTPVKFRWNGSWSQQAKSGS